jgi:hypothetical protein
MGSISISWSALAEVAGVSLGFALGIALVFSLGVLGLSRAETARQRGGAVTPYRTLTAAAFFTCAAAVCYGLYLLIPQFH